MSTHRLRAAGWATLSAGGVVAVTSAVTAAEAAAGLLWPAVGASGFETAFPLLVDPSWVLAIGVMWLVLLGTTATQVRTIRRAVVDCCIGACAYVAVGSVLATASYESPSAWISAACLTAGFAVFVFGNFWVALILPPLAGFLPPFRDSVYGSPALWSSRAYSPSDADAAAEDFNIY